jgi:integrase
MQRKLTAGFIRKAPCEPGADRTFYWDTTLPGFGLQVTERGARSYVVQYRIGRKSRRIAIKDVLKFKDAKKEARKLLGEAATGGDPLARRRKERAIASNTLKAVAQEYFKRERARVRTMDDREATFERLIFPRLGDQPIDSIQRGDINKLLDRVEVENGEIMASLTLAYLRRLFTWHAGRAHDDFRSPIVRGMARTKSEPRERILSNDEIRAVWRAAEARGGPYGSLLPFLLLTATRRMEAAHMNRRELSGSDWTIPAARYKGKRDHVVPLSPAAMALLNDIPKLGSRGWVFTNDGEHPIGGLSRLKDQFDKTCGVTGWTIHDLRRTARSLMSRAGVPSDHAERALGHVIGGVRGVYDRHAFYDEKKQGFEALAAQIERIVNPQENVVPLRSGG